MYNIFMYILEYLAKILQEKKEKKQNKPADLAETADYEECLHTFFPVDSTGETLACSKCGLLVKNGSQKIKPKNPFS